MFHLLTGITEVPFINSKTKEEIRKKMINVLGKTVLSGQREATRDR